MRKSSMTAACRLALLGAFAALAAMSNPPEATAQANRYITKHEARQWPPSRVERKILQQLATIIEETGAFREAAKHTPPIHPLTDISYVTKPRASRIPGLCRVDALTVELAPPSPRDKGAETEVHAVGFTASHHFKFLTGPTADSFDVEARQELYGESDCSKLDPLATDFFSAPNDDVANNGYWLLTRAIEETRRGPAFTIRCEILAVNKRNCPEILASLELSGLTGVEECDSELEGDDLTVCVELSFDNYRIRIVTDVSRIAIRRIQMNETITTGSIRRD
jgi:hypothetical protein